MTEALTEDQLLESARKILSKSENLSDEELLKLGEITNELTRREEQNEESSDTSYFS